LSIAGTALSGCAATPREQAAMAERNARDAACSRGVAAQPDSAVPAIESATRVVIRDMAGSCENASGYPNA
ncbi:MAG TPA: hypothetical protein DEP91_12795, partial [Sphingomonas bacterium]|nr:hypothetical protein [Sphingomonas bacterium]